MIRDIIFAGIWLSNTLLTLLTVHRAAGQGGIAVLLVILFFYLCCVILVYSTTRLFPVTGNKGN